MRDPSPLHRNHQGTTHIQRSPNSPSWLKMRDPYPDWPGKIPVVPVASQEEARSTRKVRGTPGSFHHSKSPPDVSVLSRGTFLPCTASTFTGRTDSHDGGTWDSPVESLVGKPRGKASRENKKPPDQPNRKIDSAPNAPEKSARACPHWRRR